MQQRSADGVRLERTGFRDDFYSLRHRTWGFDVPTCDLDYLECHATRFLEYDRCRPVALVEVKHFGAGPPDLDSHNIRALAELANGYSSRYLRQSIPFFVVRYWPDIPCFRIYPVNPFACLCFDDPENLSERDYVGRLYELRGRHLPHDVAARLATEVVTS